VRHILVSRERYEQAIKVMQASGDACRGVIAQLGHMLTWFKDKELSSVLSSVQRQTAWMDSPAVIKHLCSSSFDPRTLRTGRMSAFICIPSEKLVTLAPLTRLLIGSMLRIAARGADERNPVLFLIDEAAHLGKIQALEDAVTLMRGMGIRLWFFFQSLSQLNECYGEKATVFLDNFDTQQYFGTNAHATAVAISDRIGTATITSQSYASGTTYSAPSGGDGGRHGQSAQRGSSSTLTTSEMGRKLLLPEEILGLDPDIALIFHKHLPVIPARLLRYFDAPEFRRGGTGRQRELGLAALVVVAAMLLASAGFASAVSRFPLQIPVRGGMATPPPIRRSGEIWIKQPVNPGRTPPRTRFRPSADPRFEGWR
jgi:type IV secretion system protein VirD4